MKAAQLKLKDKEARLKAFNKQTGRTQRTNRQQVYQFDRSQASRAVWAKKKEVEKYSKIRYNNDGTVIVTDDLTGKKHPNIKESYRPNAVVDTMSRNGEQRDRTFYGENGQMSKQVHTGNHGNKKVHPYGKNGEHAHDYTRNGNNIVERTTRDLTEQERKENADLL